MNAAARENSSLQTMVKRPLQTFCISKKKKKNTRGGRGIISVMTSERMQALMAQVLYHSSIGLLGCHDGKIICWKTVARWNEVYSGLLGLKVNTVFYVLGVQGQS